ncbi:MAG: hypothetical protein KF850_18555 [Labilithrix sp.]|nr:hypothetical protein [Labilithrix sp.]
MLFSAAATLVVRPFRGYDALARARGQDAPTITGGALRLLFVIGAVVATTAAGRLAPIELFVATFSFAYVPLAQLVAVTAALRAVARDVPLRRAFALYLAGHGPWLVTLLAVAAICLLAPSPADVLFAVVPPLVLGTFAWSGVLTFACFRRGLGLTRARAAIATALHMIVLTAIVVGYYLGMGQLGPQIWR